MQRNFINLCLFLQFLIALISKSSANFVEGSFERLFNFSCKNFESCFNPTLQKIASSTFSVAVKEKYNSCLYILDARDAETRQVRLTFLQRGSLVLLQPLDSDGFQAYPGSRILLEHVPHILLAEDEEVRVADRAHAGCSPVTCVDVAIYWLSGCIKLSYVTAHRDRSVSIVRRILQQTHCVVGRSINQSGDARVSDCTPDTFTRVNFLSFKNLCYIVLHL